MLIPIQYHNKAYPDHINPRIAEVAAHFDIEKIRQDKSLSIHTEYSYRPRRLDSNLLNQFPTLRSAHLNNVPRLWFNRQWSIEFAGFIRKICMNKKLEVIEIHPPFGDYSNIATFISNYSEFEKSILNSWPEVNIVIENRSGTNYKGSKFVISRVRDLRKFVDEIDKTSLRLDIAWDIPQLFTAYGGQNTFNNHSLKNFLLRLAPLMHRVRSIHLWGKKRTPNGRVASHVGDLNSYFDGDHGKKGIFLKTLAELLSDGRTRYFVPEVNSNSIDLQSIVRDLEGAGIRFMV